MTMQSLIEQDLSIVLKTLRSDADETAHTQFDLQLLNNSHDNPPFCFYTETTKGRFYDVTAAAS